MRSLALLLSPPLLIGLAGVASAGSQPRRGTVMAAPIVLPQPSPESLLGRPVVTPGGRHIGQVVDVLLDRHSGQMHALVVARRPGFGAATHEVEIDGAAIRPLAGKNVVAELTAEEAARLPRWSPRAGDADQVGLRDR